MYGSSHLRARFGRGADYHTRLAMTQTGYYRAGGFFSSIKKAVGKAASVVKSIGGSTVGQVLAPLNPFGRVASVAQGVASSIPGIGGLVKAGGAVQSMLMPFGKGPSISAAVPQATQVAAGALGPALPGFGVWSAAAKGAEALARQLGGSPPYQRPALPGEVRPEWFGGKATALPPGSPGTVMQPSHVPFGGTLALPGATTKRRKKKAAGASKRRRSSSRRRRSSARRRRAPARRTRGTSAYRRGDYGDDWQGNRPSRAKGSGRFLTRRGGRRHHKRRRGGRRVSFVTKSGRRVSFMPSH